MQSDPKHDYLKELWHNRPWRYIPAVIGHMQRYPWSVVKYRPGMTFNAWLYHILNINWRVSYVHGAEAVYARCAKCLCFKCADSSCAAKNCDLCDMLSKYSLGHDRGMTTVTCGKMRKVLDEETTR